MRRLEIKSQGQTQTGLADRHIPPDRSIHSPVSLCTGTGHSPWASRQWSDYSCLNSEERRDTDCIPCSHACTCIPTGVSARHTNGGHSHRALVYFLTSKQTDLFGFQQLQYVALTCEQDPLWHSVLQIPSLSVRLPPRTAWCSTFSLLSPRCKLPRTQFAASLITSTWYIPSQSGHGKKPAHLLSKPAVPPWGPIRERGGSTAPPWKPQIPAGGISIISREAESACVGLSNDFQKQAEEEGV